MVMGMQVMVRFGANDYAILLVSLCVLYAMMFDVTIEFAIISCTYARLVNTTS